ncbi:MAG: hypothetical protein EOO39_07535, partial [Cytophagaceae bacterium]
GMNVPSSLLLQMDSSAKSNTNPTNWQTRIRFGEKEPLIILDGKEISQEEMKAIDTNTIQSINVLKDISAFSTYGEKGRNGVVQITTKKAAEALKKKDK